MANLADGEIGLIITGHAYVLPDGQAGPWQLGIDHDELITGLQRLVEAVHRRGVPMALQISHAGFYANPKLIGQDPGAVSHVEGLAKADRRELLIKDIQTIVEAFGRAGLRAKQAGFDGVQIHAAHGYLLNQFLSPVFNRRSDRYGGSLENRFRAVSDIIASVRHNVGPDFPLLIKLNCGDFINGGLNENDFLRIGKLSAEHQVDAIEVSGGTLISGKLGPSRMSILTKNQEGYFGDCASRLKKLVSVPIITVGGIRSFEVAKKIIEEKRADYISMSRPFIREHHLIKRGKSGDLHKATCISDNGCFMPG